MQVSDNATAQVATANGSTTKQSFAYLINHLKKYTQITRPDTTSAEATAYGMLTGVRVKKYDNAGKIKTSYLAKLSLPGTASNVEIKVISADESDLLRMIESINTTNVPVPVKFTATVYGDEHIINGNKVTNGGRYATVSVADRAEYDKFAVKVDEINEQLRLEFANVTDFDKL